MLLVSCLGLAALALTLAGCQKAEALPAPPPPAVTVDLPTRKAVKVYGEYVGQLASPQMVELRARVDGFVKEINFKDGAEVKAGALLFVIDPAPYEVVLRRAKAQLQSSEAVLDQARDTKQIEVTRAAVQKAEAVYANMVQQRKDQEIAVKANAVARELLDTAISNEKQAAAQLASDRATLLQAESDYKHAIAKAEASVAVDQAAVAAAELNLSYTKVFAPLDGLIGRAEVKVGSLVQQTQATLMATIWDIRSLWVYFSISEREALTLKRFSSGKKAGAEAGELTTEIILEDGTLYPHRGTYDFASPSFDMNTGTLTLRAEFPNPEKMLRPGNYAKVRMLLTQRNDALLVTERAIGTDQGGKYLLVVNDKDIVERRAVSLGEHIDGMVEIAEGLSGSERVVVNGLQRARPGAPVTPKTEAAKAENGLTAKKPSGPGG
jgi:RND family efflux transporter MFP subunit